MATRTSTRKPVAPVVSPEAQAVFDAVAQGSTPVSLVHPDRPTTEPASKPSAHDRLVHVLGLLDKATAKELEPADVKWGKAIGLLGGGSVYINRSNADVRSTTKQVADWAKSGLGVARGPQGQYLRISF